MEAWSMRPIAVLTAIIFGSAAALTFALAGVVIVFIVLQGRHPELAAEFGMLLRSSALFALLAAISGLSLFAMLKGLRWRWIAQGALWFTLTAIATLYWRS
jgi:hypothetical protein